MLLWPNGSTATPRISDGYGPRGNVAGLGTLPFHHGVDIPLAYGTKLVAAADGEVVFSGWWMGVTVVVRVWIDGFQVDFMYTHMQEGSNADLGPISQGDAVGFVGLTGQTTGPHTCFRIIVNGSYFTYFGSQEPITFMTEHNAPGAMAGRPSAPIEEDDMYDAAARDEVVGRMDRQIIPLLTTLVARSRGLVAFRSDPNVEYQGKRGGGEIFIAAPGVWFHAPPAYWALAQARGVVDAPINIGWNEVSFWRDVIYMGAERDDKEILSLLKANFPESAASEATSKLTADA